MSEWLKYLWETIRLSHCVIIYSHVCYSLEELGIVQDKRVCCATAQLNTDSQNSIDKEGGISDCVSVGQERYKQKLRHGTHPGETSLGTDTHKKCLSEETNLATQSRTQKGKKLHYCQSCAIVFPSYYSLLHHNCIKNREGGFKCSVCNEWFCEKQTLAVHVLVHSGTLSFSRWSKAVDMWFMQTHSPVLGPYAENEGNTFLLNSNSLLDCKASHSTRHESSQSLPWEHEIW